VSWRIRTPWALGAFFVLAFLLYRGSLRHPLVFDDLHLTESSVRAFWDLGLNAGRRGLSNASFGWVYAAFGPDWYWQRAANVLLHAGVASMLFFFLRRLYEILLPAEKASAQWTALLGALLFLVHPAAVYGVAYLIQRSILMGTLFSLLSLWLFLEGLVRSRSGWFAGAAAAYFAAVLSKEHCVMLPAVAAALALLLRGWSPKLLRELALPMLLYAAIGLYVTLQSRGVLGDTYESFAGAALRQAPESAGGARAYPLSVVNQGYLFFRYLLTWLFPWPGWMSIDVRPGFPAALASWPQGAGFLLWLAWPLAGVALLARRGRAGLVGFAMLAPWLLSLTEVVTVRIQEMFVLYRSYLWMALLPAALPALLPRMRPLWRHGLLAAACLALLVPLFDRIGSFSSDLKLWDDAVGKIADPKAPYADRSYRNRGVAYYRLGRYPDALADFEKAIELDPGSAKAWMLRGTVWMLTGHSSKALADFDISLKLEPENAEVLGRRCVVRMRLRQLEEALADCNRAAELAPGDLDSHISLGMVQALRGATVEAERHYRRALEIEPGAGFAHYQYGVLLRGLGRMDEAQREMSAACAAGLRNACAPGRSR
jgi:tetratricopeptide (TPR) repeat protein